jgi:hypothetical protein
MSIFILFYFFDLIASSGRGEGGSQYHSSNLNGYIRRITGLGFEKYR